MKKEHIICITILGGLGIGGLWYSVHGQNGVFSRQKNMPLSQEKTNVGLDDNHIQYIYDSLGRVIAALYPDGTKLEYEYDRSGNMLSCNVVHVTTEEGAGEETKITETQTREEIQVSTGETSEKEENGTEMSEIHTEDKTEIAEKRTESEDEVEPTERTTEQKEESETTRKPTEQKTESNTTGDNGEEETKITEQRTEQKEDTEGAEKPTEQVTKADGAEETTEQTTKADGAEKLTEQTTETIEKTVEEITEGPAEDRTTEKRTTADDSKLIEAVPLFPQYTAEDVKNYNLFKKRRPVIKSLKEQKKSGKYYLILQIKQVAKRGKYGESGYQIQYAANKKLKRAKNILLQRKKKGSITQKKWKVKAGKTYYVRVRAYMKTRTGKKIYTKYSKTKSIQVKKR